MKKAKYTWKIQENSPLPEEYTAILESEKISPLLGQLLWHRGIQTAEQLAVFLHPTSENIYNPFLIHDMSKAVERIQTAVANGERILVYGDYDADGITSTTVMKEAIELVGGEVEYFIPNRFVHGYGPNLEVFKEKIEAGIQLIITVDNGVAGHEALDYASKQRIDVIVTDHHELPSELPSAYAIIHPKHPEGKYPFSDLAGVGVAFKVATALLDELPVEFLDLVAIGTIADLVSLTDENRVLVKMGLQAIRTSERIGLSTLIQAIGLKKESINEENIGFAIGPRLNALGRLGEAAPGVELMSTFDEVAAEGIVQHIDNQNNERKEIVNRITKEAFELIDLNENIHIVAKSDWHEGVLGIVAGRIMQDTGKPTIVLTVNEQTGLAKGSGRSVASFNLFDSLNEIRELFTHFGGHHMAAGMTLPVENITKVKEHIKNYLNKNDIDFSQGQELVIDAPLEVNQATVAFVQQLATLAPFGTDNPIPNFLFAKAQVEQLRQIGTDNAHLKCQLNQSGQLLDVIAFQMGNQIDELTIGKTSFVGQLSINEWNGNKKPQLMVTDFSVTGQQLFDLRGKTNQQKDFPIENTLYLLFDKTSHSFIKELPTETNTVLFTSLDICVEVIKQQGIQQIVFVDCPLDSQKVKEVVQQATIDRVYLMFQSKEEAYLNGVGTREQFAKLYSFVMKQKQVDVRYKLAAVATYLTIPEKLLIYMIQVFFDLGFVTIENGVLTKVDNIEKRPLTESKIYQDRLRKIETEKFLLYSDCAVLRQWLWNEEE